MSTHGNRPPEELGVMTPFQGMPQQVVPPPHSATHSTAKWILVGVFSVVGVLSIVLVGLLLWKHTVNDPYRTLEVFTAEKYFDNPRALIGNHFQATLRVEGELGWSADVGKLMVFSLENDNRFLPVLIKANSPSYSFSKGQLYLAQLMVGEGGLLYATDLRKK